MQRNGCVTLLPSTRERSERWGGVGGGGEWRQGKLSEQKMSAFRAPDACAAI